MKNLLQEFETYLLSLDDDSFKTLIKHYCGVQKSYTNRYPFIQTLAGYLQTPSSTQVLVKNLKPYDKSLLALVNHFNPVTANMVATFWGNISLHRATSLLKSLQERLWLIYYPQNQSYSLNPLLLNLFETLNLSFDNFFNYTSLNPTPPDFWLSPSQLTAFLALHQHSQKKVKIGLTTSQELMLNQSLKNLGLIHSKGLNRTALEEFANLTFESQVAFLVAGYASDQRWRQKILVQVIETLFLYYKKKWINAQLVTRWYGFYQNEIPPPNLMNLLQSFGLWQVQGNQISLTQLVSTQNQNWLIDSTNTCYFMPDQSLCVALAASFTLEHYDTVSQYSLSQESFFRALSIGYTANSLKLALQKEGASSFPDTLESSFNHWSATYSRAELFKGYVLKIAPEIEAILTKHGLDQHIEAKISKGVYLLKQEPSPQFLANLEQMAFRKPIIRQPLALPHSLVFEKSKPFELEVSSELTEEILPFESQNPFYQELEYCSGLDFQGKLRLVKMAINKNLNLILEVGLKEEQKLYVKPLSLTIISMKHQLTAQNLNTDKPLKGLVESLIGVTLIKPHLIS